LKISFNEEETLNHIIQEEDMELTWINKQLGAGKSTIFSTEGLAKQYKRQLQTKENFKTFQPFKINFLLLSIAGLLFIFMMINAVIKEQLGGEAVFFIFFICLFIAVGIGGNIINKEKNYKIIVSKSGMTISKINYSWEEIHKTYIVLRPKGKAIIYFLILALDTGVTDRYDFTNLYEWSGTEKKLSAYIEYYKNLAKDFS
jgi:hypothetical protein